MSFWDWVKQKLLGLPPRRDVSRLAPDQDSTSEKVDVSGGPLKPGHRRRALRDPRLLPKARVPLGKRPRQMSKAEAERLFSDSLRTRNRQQRDLLCDQQQLQGLQLPLWKSEEDLAAALNLTLPQLRSFAFHRMGERHAHYVTFAVPKRGGGERLILAPKKRLKAIQRLLHGLLAEKLPVSAAAHGFRKGRSTLSNATPHVGKAVVVRFDLKDFFPHCTWQRVRGMLVAYGYSFPVATTLTLLMTESERQPLELEDGLVYVPVRTRYCVQGAPTSPALANALALKLDRRLLGLARKLGFDYTRYADDMTFSGAEPSKVGVLLRAVGAIVESEGFFLNPDKTRVMRKGRRQSVTGVVVNQVAGLSRQQRRKLRAALHQSQANKNGDGVVANSNKMNHRAFARLRGMLAYLAGLNPEQARRLLKVRDRKSPPLE